MKQFKLLVSLKLKEYFSFFTRTKVSIGKKIFYIILPILILALLLLTTISTAISFIPPLLAVDRLDLLLPSILLMTIALVFLFATRRIKPMLFITNDIDFLKTLPIKPFLIPLSKLLIFYVFSVLLTLILLLGADILLIIVTDASITPLFLNILMSFLIPIFPIMLATFIILPFSIMAKYYRVSKLLRFLDIFFTSLITIALIFTISLVPLMNENHVNILSNVINNFFFTYFYKNALSLNLLYIIIFILMNVFLLIGFIMFLNKFYFKLHNVLSRKDKKKDYESTYLKNTSISKALFFKELKLYKSAHGYVMNTIIFPIMIAAGVIIIFILRIMGLIDPIFDSPFHNLIIILIVPSLMSLNSFKATTAFSISLEGPNFYLLKSLPIETKKVIDSKIKLHMIMLGFTPAISAFIIGILLNAGILYSLIFLLVLLLHSYFMANFGIIINLLFPKLNYKTEISVIKNSLAQILMMFFAQLLLIPIALPVIILALNNHYIISLITLVSIVSLYTILTRLFVLKKSETMFNKLNY